ncbi:imidazole glycerol phosphate synthase subunit HisH [Alteribacter natronophilus]|uniref:imidazole glycerol phosphate synthase subunit HisH n=1 Tax=Alteribacter natronophilus TaxID=2583810 RepID=UPI00110F3DB9|nr:imidazole glycerol phosphate synthase subunit HisH [Alteribacter natronophilus]TMW72414.1 imidazole glycerol phosphate synthase subunit HisH [Alteribacter natronophilus]
MIGIIDYGMGNLHSVSKALERLGYPYVISGEKAELERAESLILPGVGSFRDGMTELDESGLTGFVREWAAEGKPLLGICLGMQLLFDESEENGLTKGLGLLRGRVEKLTGMSATGKRYKVPHMGWNELHVTQPGHPFMKNLSGGHVYFVHSYAVNGEEPSDLIAYADYYERVPAVVAKENVWGTQFHPEKSGPVGVTLLNNFARAAEGGRI